MRCAVAILPERWAATPPLLRLQGIHGRKEDGPVVRLPEVARGGQYDEVAVAVALGEGEVEGSSAFEQARPITRTAAARQAAARRDCDRSLSHRDGDIMEFLR